MMDNNDIEIQQLQDELRALRQEVARLKQHQTPLPPDLIAGKIEWDSASVLRAIFENAQPVIFILDSKGTFLVSEGKGLSALGLQPGQVVGSSAYTIYRDNPKIIAGIDAALGGKFIRDKVLVGEIIFDAFFSPYRDDTGKIQGVLGMAVDITEREQALNQLRQMTQIVEQSTDSIIYTAVSYTHLTLPTNREV